MEQKRRLDLDIVRTWLCTAVMLVHVFGILIPYYGMDNLKLSTFYAAISTLIRLNVPGFVFLAGFLAVYRKTTFDKWYFWRSRLHSTVPFYLLFTLVYFLLSYRTFGLGTLIMFMFKGSASYHLYFVPILLQLYLLTPLLIRGTRQCPKLTLWTAAALSYGFCAVRAFSQDALLALLSEPFWCLPYLFYYVWGLVAADMQERIWSAKRLLVSLAAFICLALSWGSLVHLAAYAEFMPLPNPWYSMLLTLTDYIKNVLGFMTLRQIGLRMAKRLPAGSRGERFFTHLSGYSYLIYLAHPLLLGWLNLYIVRQPERLFLAFLPLVCLFIWLYSHAEQRLRTWRRDIDVRL